MTDATQLDARTGARGPEKFAARRVELATATLITLAELGYARTSLREIAQNSSFSHGVLHYYFRDKLDLIAEAVRIYEGVCVTRYDEAVASATTAEELRQMFSTMFVTTLQSDSSLHRLWYDLRNQTRYEASLRAEVSEIEARRTDMVWNVVSRYCELRGEPARLPQQLIYLTFDGIAQQGLDNLLDGTDPDMTRSQTLLEQAFDAI
ncbi:TetR/AcrR family transcriptional regulator [Rhodococcoides kyotonense]|uniref:TetR family transcriptional regulator n=1 Tax=Rhodococcoides kyotonense TaxID=398843 RepID=A0A177Y878_9NOCA|nr:TetR/AcrR family transcriptional regulator [Rhodococcus kyotonensis]OAK51419.1 TetR family transcriptional regulator [Rhodococcus kyotonensis]